MRATWDIVEATLRIEVGGLPAARGLCSDGAGMVMHRDLLSTQVSFDLSPRWKLSPNPSHTLRDPMPTVPVSTALSERCRWQMDSDCFPKPVDNHRISTELCCRAHVACPGLERMAVARCSSLLPLDGSPSKVHRLNLPPSIFSSSSPPCLTILSLCSYPASPSRYGASR